MTGTFETIPNEVLRLILSHLSRVQQNAVLGVSALWKYLGITLLREEYPYLIIEEGSDAFALLKQQQQIYRDLADGDGLPFEYL